MPPKKNHNFSSKRSKRWRPKVRHQNGNKGSQGGPWTSQPKELGPQLFVGKIPLFPPKYKALLRYSDSITIDSTSGVPSSWLFSANGLYDPNITGTGHQPAGFDQMMLSYEHYTVVKARMTATFHNNSGTPSVYISPIAGLSINANNSPTTIINQIIEDGLVTTARLNTNGSQGCFQTLQRSINIGKFGGVSNVLNDPTYRGTVASNPSEQSYFILQLWSTENATCTAAIDVLIEFEAIFTEPRTLTESLAKSIILSLKKEEKTKD